MATMPFEMAFILAKQGDKDALAELYETARPLLINYVRHYTRNDEIAEDIVSDVLYIMVRDIQKLQTNNGKAFYVWLRTIAYNKAMDYLSKVRTTDPLDKANPISWDDPALRVETVERDTIIHEAVRSLSGKTRGVIVGSFVEGLPTHTLAKMAGKSHSAIRQIKSRGLKVLRTILSPRIIAAIVSCGLLLSGGFVFFYVKSQATPQGIFRQFIYAGDSHGSTPRQRPINASTFKPMPTPAPSPSPTPTPEPSPSPVPPTAIPVQTVEQTQPTAAPTRHKTTCVTNVCIKSPLL